VAGCKLYEVPSAGSENRTASVSVTPRQSEFPSPLSTRGWALQERLFAPRTLEFGSLIIWECKTGIFSELKPDLKQSMETPLIKNIFDGFEQPGVSQSQSASSYGITRLCDCLQKLG
jgi:hypothetical protein